MMRIPCLVLTDGGATGSSGSWQTGLLTTEHPSSSYGQAVLTLTDAGQAYGPRDIPDLVGLLVAVPDGGPAEGMAWLDRAWSSGWSVLGILGPREATARLLWASDDEETDQDTV